MNKTATRYIHLFLLILPLIAVGCASSGASKRYIPSFADPDFFGKHYTYLAIHYQTPMLGDRQSVEEALSEEIRQKKTFAAASGTIIPPTRSWDSVGIRNALVTAGYDGYLRIVETDTWTEEYRVPEEQKTTVKREAEQKKVPAPRKGGEESGRDTVIKVVETETTTTTTTGGYTSQIPWTQFRIELIDLASGRIAWIGNSTIRGSIGDGAENFSEKVAAQLGQDGMIRDAGRD